MVKTCLKIHLAVISHNPFQISIQFGCMYLSWNKTFGNELIASPFEILPYNNGYDIIILWARSISALKSMCYTLKLFLKLNELGVGITCFMGMQARMPKLPRLFYT